MNDQELHTLDFVDKIRDVSRQVKAIASRLQNYDEASRESTEYNGHHIARQYHEEMLVTLTLIKTAEDLLSRAENKLRLADKVMAKPVDTYAYYMHSSDFIPPRDND